MPEQIEANFQAYYVRNMTMTNNSLLILITDQSLAITLVLKIPHSMQNNQQRKKACLAVRRVNTNQLKAQERRRELRERLDGQAEE